MIKAQICPSIKFSVTDERDKNSPDASARANAGLFCPFVSMRGKVIKKFGIIQNEFCSTLQPSAREKIYLTKQTPYLMERSFLSFSIQLQKLSHLIQPSTSHSKTKSKSLEQLRLHALQDG